MNKQDQKVGLGKSRRRPDPASSGSLPLVGSATLVGAFSNFVVQLDTHRVGAAIFLGAMVIVVGGMMFGRRRGN